MMCDRCKHVKEISELFRECQNCASHGDRCATCKVYLDKKKEAERIEKFCENCGVGRLVHYDGADGGMETVVAAAGGIAADAPTRQASSLSTGVTKLDPDTEEKLRVALASIMELKPLELLLVQHVFSRRPTISFCETLRQLRDRLTNRYDLRDEDENGDKPSSFKALVSLWGQKIVEKVPALAGVFAAYKFATAYVR